MLGVSCDVTAAADNDYDDDDILITDTHDRQDLCSPVSMHAWSLVMTKRVGSASVERTHHVPKAPSIMIWTSLHVCFAIPCYICYVL